MARVVVVGSGIAGLVAALTAQHRHEVLLVTKGTLAESSTRAAQGGIAAVTAPGDSVALHVEDTLTAGAGLAVRSLLLPGSLVRIPLAEIADVEAGLAHARHWGGHGNGTEHGMTSILRGDGAALLVTRTDGSQVIVSVERPDPDRASVAATSDSRIWPP